MKKEELIVLQKNGISHKRIEFLKQQLQGYKELKKEVTKIEKLLIKKEKEISELHKSIIKSKKTDMLKGLK